MHGEIIQTSTMRIIAFDDFAPDSVLLGKLSDEPDDDFWMVPTFEIVGDIATTLIEELGSYEVWPVAYRILDRETDFRYDSADPSEPIRINHTTTLVAIVHKEGLEPETKGPESDMKFFLSAKIFKDLLPQNVYPMQFNILKDKDILRIRDEMLKNLIG